MLHCLYKIYKSVHPDVYGADSFTVAHVEHCVDNLRQVRCLLFPFTDSLTFDCSSYNAMLEMALKHGHGSTHLSYHGRY
jgi:hypothetical protein